MSPCGCGPWHHGGRVSSGNWNELSKKGASFRLTVSHTRSGYLLRTVLNMALRFRRPGYHLAKRWKLRSRPRSRAHRCSSY